MAVRLRTIVVIAHGAARTGNAVDGVFAMLEAGLSDHVIVAKFRKEARSFDLSTDDLIRLSGKSDPPMRCRRDDHAVGHIHHGSRDVPVTYPH